jgi:hypothetical protein
MIAQPPHKVEVLRVLAVRVDGYVIQPGNSAKEVHRERNGDSALGQIFLDPAFGFLCASRFRWMTSPKGR